MAKYRKKPIVIDAVQWNGSTKNFNKIQDLNIKGKRKILSIGNKTNERLIINTLEGDMTASMNDWIIKGISGEIYPCKPDIFDKTYELIE